jgi:hypothetical protein
LAGPALNHHFFPAQQTFLPFLSQVLNTVHSLLYILHANLSSQSLIP